MKTIKERENFIFNESLSEIPLEPKSEEQVKTALFKDFNPDKLVDEYEARMGLKFKEAPQPNLRYKHVMLSPGFDEEDAALLNQLYNDPELYQVINRSNYWTPRGELKLFIEYMENMTVKEAREKAKEKEETKHE